ncbi:MAG: response regulator [Treponema sp.]|nr:response regulator [Treponema sp.]
MNILALDDEYLGLEGLVTAIKANVPNAIVGGYRDIKEALDYAEKTNPEIAFLDIELRMGNGLDVAKKLKAMNPRINIIFVTGYSEYMKEAFDLYASGYVLKPVMNENIKKELENLRFPVSEKKRISVHTFGNFEIFGDGIPLTFAYSKSKELLAILVDANGITCSMGMVEELMWEREDDCRDHRAYIRNLIADIRRSLRKFNAEDIILRSHNNIGLKVSDIDCDYYDYLAGKPEAIAAFNGEYMSQYSWAEKTLGSLLKP